MAGEGSWSLADEEVWMMKEKLDVEGTLSLGDEGTSILGDGGTSSLADREVWLMKEKFG